jgi:transitional endoplasmic reticulum ATPase
MKIYNETLSLKVCDLKIGIRRNTARMYEDTMDLLNIRVGDIIEIIGKRKTSAMCLPAYSHGEENRQIIYLDYLQQRNALADIGSIVNVRKTRAMLAKEITLKCTEEMPKIDVSSISEALDEIVVVIGDYISIPYLGTQLTYKVIGSDPNASVRIRHEFTKVMIK